MQKAARVNCPAENTLLGYVGGILDDESGQEVERHLDGCSTCRFLFAELARADGGGAPAASMATALGLANPLELPTGTVVGRYVIVGLEGRGGMGVVYKAFDPELDRTIALKVVGLAGLGRGAEEARLRLAREARTLAQLSHPNVVAVHDVGTFEGDVFLAMEFVHGRTLRAWLREREPGPREVLAVFLAAGAGLAAAHRVGIVHRDFKPDNVMVGDDGRVRVLDFGLARSAVAPARDDTAASPALVAGSALTREGAIVGTPGYMAPEQDRGGEVDARSDQFSFCAALFEALYGRLPFDGATYAEMSENRLAGEIASPPALRGVSARVRRALLDGLRVDPDERHRDMDALLAELDQRPRATRRRIAAALLAVAAAASGGWARLGPRDRRAQHRRDLPGGRRRRRAGVEPGAPRRDPAQLRRHRARPGGRHRGSGDGDARRLGARVGGQADRALRDADAPRAGDRALRGRSPAVPRAPHRQR